MTRVIITGASGSIGGDVIARALASASITGITLLIRQPLPSRAPYTTFLESPKLQTIIHKDFLDYPSSLIEQLRDHDACLWLIGSPFEPRLEIFRRINVEMPVRALHAFREAGLKGKGEGAGFLFAYVSGDIVKDVETAKKSYIPQARIKAEAELLLSSLATPSLRVVQIRPGIVSPSLSASAHTQGRVRTVLNGFVTPFAPIFLPWVSVRGNDLADAIVATLVNVNEVQLKEEEATVDDAALSSYGSAQASSGFRTTPSRKVKVEVLVNGKCSQVAKDARAKGLVPRL